MHLITALAAGVKGAEDGTAEIYSRGSSTPAGYYTDFEGTDAIAAGTVVELDSNGGASIYVNEYVIVVVKGSSGTEVRTFTDGVQANAVEVISDSFTGVDYTSGASAVNKPVSLGAVLNRWNDSAGTTGIDFKVDVNGTGTNLSSIAASVTGLFFNVKDPAYGATGDGSTDDTAAIQAAENAADDNGGTLYFPPGTYNITAALAIDGNVNMVGAGTDATYLSLNSAANADLLALAAATKGLQKISGISFICAQANSGSFIGLAASSRVLITNCHFLGDNMTGEMIDGYTATPSYLAINDNVFEGGSSTIDHIRTTATSAFVINNTFIINNTAAHNCVRLERGSVDHNYFNMVGNGNAGSHYVYADNNATDDFVMAFGNIMSTSGAANGMFAFGLASDEVSTDRGLIEVGNYVKNPTRKGWDISLSPSDLTDVTTEFKHYMGIRNGRNDADNAGTIPDTITIKSVDFEINNINIIGTSALTFNAPLAVPNSKLTLVFYNSAGGASGVLTWGAMFAGTAAATWSFAADMRTRMFTFISTMCELSDDTAELRWLQISDSGELTIAP
jgi:hypothetical protein